VAQGWRWIEVSILTFSDCVCARCLLSLCSICYFRLLLACGRGWRLVCPVEGGAGGCRWRSSVAASGGGSSAIGYRTSRREQIKRERAGIREQGVGAVGEKPGKIALSRALGCPKVMLGSFSCLVA